jgi:hypothetical protein
MEEDHWQALLDEPPSVDVSDPEGLTLSGRLHLMARLRAERSWLEARESEVLLAVVGPERRERHARVADPDGGRPRDVVVSDEVVDLVAAATRQSVTSVRRRATTARLLGGGLRPTRDHLAAGLISPEHAEVIARTADGLPADLLGRYESRVLAAAVRMTAPETGACARRIRARLDPGGEERRRDRARRHIGVHVWAEDDGLACLQARLPFADAARLHRALDERALRMPVDPQVSMGERRASALVAAVCGSAVEQASDSSTRSATAGVEIQVVVDLATLMSCAGDVLGLTPALVQLGSGPAEPVAAAAVRDLLADPAVPVTLRRLVVDPITGELLDRGRRAYRVPDATRAFLVARDATCRFPHCRRAAVTCDVDHVRAWESGGRTDRDNLVPLCRRHHLLKTHASWSIRQRRADGVVLWSGPDGRQYASQPLAPHRALGRWDPG